PKPASPQRMLPPDPRLELRHASFFLTGGWQILPCPHLSPRSRRGHRSPPPRSFPSPRRPPPPPASPPARICTAHHHPLIVLLLQVILNRHLSRAATLPSKRNRRVCLVPVELHRRHVDVHGGCRHTLCGQIVEHALTHRVVALNAAMTAG